MKDMMRFVVTVCLSVMFSLGAQAYTMNDDGRFHRSSVYYFILTGDGGADITRLYAADEGAVGAFIGGELRGVSVPMTTPAGMVLMVRVWGADDEPAATQVIFRLQQSGLEYELGAKPFASDGQSESTFGEPSSPVKLAFAPVTGVSLSPSSVSVLEGRSQNVEATLLPLGHTPLVTAVSYSFSSSDTDVFSVESEGSLCRVKGVHRGTGMLTVRVLSGETVVLQSSAAVSVITEPVAVTSIRNDMPSLTVETVEGGTFTLAYTVLPENATNRDVDFRIGNATLLYYITNDYGQTTFYAVKPGETTVTVVSKDNENATLTYTIKIKEIKAPTFGFAQTAFTLSKLRDVQMALTVDGSYVADKLELVFDNVKEGMPAAKAIKADDKGLNWTARGLFVGQYQVRIRYNGNVQQATARVDIPAEVSFDDGWDWISVFVPAPLPLIDDKSGDYLSAMNMDASNKVIELRSQKGAVYNDEKLGLFGDIKQLTAADGAYKIKSRYEAKNAAIKVFNFGMAADGKAAAEKMPMVEPGYTWIGYPHEQNHTLATLQPFLSATAVRGDVIIGRDAFIEFDGEKWLGSLKIFESGKGYIYYTENAKPFRLNWGDYYLPIEESVAASAPAPWHYDARQYPSAMTIVATLDGSADASRYSVGAFVGDECRGHGETADGRHLFIAVTGNPGETVSFKLYDHFTQSYVPLDETVRFAAAKGSLRKPFVFNTLPAGISAATSETFSLSYSGQTITVNGAGSSLTVSVSDLSGHLVMSSHSAITTVDLPHGIYVVTASDGTCSKTIKITK